MNLNWILLIFVLLVVSCDNKEYMKMEKMKGLSESQIIEKLGKPVRKNIIYIHKNSSFTEYQFSLLVLKSSLKSNLDTIEVKEMFWEHKKRKQVIWLTKEKWEWKEFDNLTWSTEIQF